MTESTTEDSPEDQLPQEVVAALRSTYRPAMDVPESVDRAILADANAHLRSISPVSRGRTRRRGRVWMAVSTGSLAAAMLVFVMWPSGSVQKQQFAEMTQQTRQPDRGNSELNKAQAAGLAVALAQDIDRNGTVNILDAFALARTIEAGDAGVDGDQNGDGRLTDDDVSAIASAVVML